MSPFLFIRIKTNYYRGLVSNLDFYFFISPMGKEERKMANERPLKILTDLVVQQDITVSGSTAVSGSEYLHTTASFTNANVTKSADGMYDVDTAIHALDTAIGTLSDNVKNAYENVRLVVTGTLDANGNQKINLTTAATSGSIYFNTDSLKLVDVSVLLAGNDLVYKNDLVSIQMYNSGSALWVEIDAPASPNFNYRLIASNNDSLPLV